MKPITPDDIASLKLQNFPPEVIQAFNEHIAMNYVNGNSTFKHCDVRETMKQRLIAAGRTFSLGDLLMWANIEDIYEDAGWKVSYDKPGFNEEYSATFIFKRVN